jgi:hypothetical protein
MSDAAEALDSSGAHDPVDAIARLRALGLSESSLLGSNGVAQHQRRLRDGAVSRQTLDEYAANLERIVARANTGEHPIPVDFWDVCSPDMRRAHYDEYQMAQTLALLEFAPYLALLGRAFARFAVMKSGADTAVAAALAILEDTSAYIRAGHSTRTISATIRALPWLDQPQQALVLWQQSLTGSTRRLPLVGLEVIPHGMWGRFNVTTIWQYARGRGGARAALWGVSGFHPDYVGPASNNNQIEHMAISAVTQRVFHVPALALLVVEYVQWKLQRGVEESETRADSALNYAVARDLLPYYSVSNPRRAAERLIKALRQPAPKR